MILALAAAAAAFAPPLDQPIRYRVVEERNDGTRTLHFAVDRSVVFTRREGSYEATVTTLAVRGAAPAEPAQVFERAMGAFVGKPLRFTLDASGKVIGAAIEPGVWSGFVDALAASTRKPGAPSARSATADALLAPLRGAPPARQAQLLAGALAPLIPAGDTPLIPAGPRAVTSSARTPTGGTVTMTGEERVEIAPGGLLRLVRSLAGAAPGAAPVDMRSTFEMTVEQSTGLVRSMRSETVLSTGGHAETIIRQVSVS